MEAERGKGVAWKQFMSRSRYMASQGLGWNGALVARDAELHGGIGRVVSEPGEDGVAWVYWGKSDHGKHESREVVVEMVRLDTNPEFMRGYKQMKDENDE